MLQKKKLIKEGLVISMQYSICRKNILAHELIGLQAKVIDSKDENKKGLHGRIVDETKHTLKLEEVNGKEKVLPKKEIVLEVEFLNGEKVEVNGKDLIGKAEDRVKEFWRKSHGRM